ncbi:MAG: amidohydrolase family protein [Desulfosarcinaceae bacterium]|nr:amidohydrolase family protein [Desulfosarcinaceae bacterium]
MRPASLRVLAGWLIDGSGAPARTDVVLEIKAGRITAVRPSGRDPLPPDLDLSSATLLPTLVDAHVHLTMSGSADLARRQRQLRMEYPEAEAVIGRHLARHRRRGITVVRDGGDHYGHTLSYKHRAAPGAVHIAAAGRAWHAPGRYGRLIGRPPAARIELGAAIARCSVGMDHVKIVNSGLNSLRIFGKETAPQFAAAELRRAVAAADALGLPVMVHANGRHPVAEALAAGCTSIEHGFFMGRTNLEAMAAGSVVWVPTVVTMAAYGRHLAQGREIGGAAADADLDVVRRNRDHQLAQLRMARRLGVRLAVGTDAGSLGVDHGTAFVEEMRFLAQAGFTIEAIVAAATSSGARLAGFSDRGRLAAGQRADFIAVPGPPQTLLARLTAPPALYLAGRHHSSG